MHQVFKLLQFFSKLANIQSEGRYYSIKSPNFRDVCMVGAQKLPHHINVCKIARLCGAIYVFVSFKHGNFTDCWKIFVNWSQSKVEKTV